MTPILAIDPGKGGGLAFANTDGMVEAWPMPETEGDVCDVLCAYRAAAPDMVAVIEQVGGFGAGSGSAMFKFGEGYGFAQGVLMALAVPMQRVVPQRWQKELHVGSRGDMTPTEWKNKLKAEAQRRFPHLRITLATADALLILAWKMESMGRR